MKSKQAIFETSLSDVKGLCKVFALDKSLISLKAVD
jgi:hypothetical protein